MSDGPPGDESDGAETELGVAGPTEATARRTVAITAVVIVLGVIVVIGVVAAATRRSDTPPNPLVGTTSTTAPLPAATVTAVPGTTPTPVGTIGTGLVATVATSITTCRISGSIATVAGSITNTLGHEAGFRITVELANPDTLQLLSGGVSVTTNVLAPNQQSPWELTVTDVPAADHVTCRVVSIAQT